MDLKKLLVWLSLPVALAAAAAALDRFNLRPVLASELRQLEEQVASNSRTLALQRWQYLVAKRGRQGLDPFEQAELCLLARELHLASPGCAG